MSMEKGAAIVAKRTVAWCGRGLMNAAATDSMQNANYTKVTRPTRPFALRPVAVMHWKEVSCNHDGMMRMESDYAAFAALGLVLPLLALRTADLRAARNTIRANQPADEKHTDTVQRTRNSIGHNEA
jgi:hypothetical protein